MFTKICLITLLCFYCSKIVAENEIPSSIQHCRRYDPNVLDCIVKAESDAIKLFKNGYPERDIDPIDPVKAESIIIKGKSNRQFRLDQIYKNVEIYGLTDVVLKEINGTIEECVFHQKLYYPRLEVLSDYEIHGNLLLFNVNGFGKSNITLKDVAALIKITCEFFKKDNTEYVKFNDLTVKLKTTNVYFDMDNLVNGNKELSDVLNTVLNENAMEIFKEYNVPYAQVIAVQILSRAKKIVKDVPISKLFLPEL